MNSYITIHEYVRAVTGQYTASLIGNLCRLNAGVSAGATSITVTPALTVQLNQYDIITIFDGSSTEQLTVQAQANVGATTVSVSATGYAHVAGTSFASDGTLGSLAQTILDGSSEVEKICQQPLLQRTVSGETLSLGSTRATVNNNSTLILRPRQFPITAFSSLSIEYTSSNIVSLDATQAIINGSGMTVNVPVIKQTSQNQQFYQYLSQTVQGNVIIGYTAGYTYTQLPPIIKRCAVWLTSDMLSDQQNPTGAAQLNTGDKQLVTYLRGDTSGESGLYKRARAALFPYTQDAW